MSAKERGPGPLCLTAFGVLTETGPVLHSSAKLAPSGKNDPIPILIQHRQTVKEWPAFQEIRAGLGPNGDLCHEKPTECRPDFLPLTHVVFLPALNYLAPQLLAGVLEKGGVEGVECSQS